MCSVWSECLINVLHVNKNISLSFDGQSFSDWIEIIIQVAYYHYQRQEIILYKKFIASLANTFYREHHFGKRLLYFLKMWHMGPYIHEKEIEAMKDTYFVYVMLIHLRQQRNDWDLYNRYLAFEVKSVHPLELESTQFRVW
eukprot:194517_1